MIKRFFIKLFIFLFVIASILYFVLFTQYGNDFLKPYVENKINSYLSIPVNLDTFVLRHNRFNIDMSSPKGVTFKSSGTFSLFSQDINGILTMYVNKLTSSQNTKNNENDFSDSELKIESVVKGKLNNFKINTVSKIKNGNLRADFYVIGFRLFKFDIDGEKIDLASLLIFMKKKPYANGEVDIRANISNNFPMVTGNMVIDLMRGDLREDLIKQDFGIQLPSTAFNANLNVNFNGKNALHNFKLFSNKGTIESRGTTDLKTRNLDASYKVNIKNLGALTPIFSTPLYGSLQTNGNLKLNNSLNHSFLRVEGNTNFALGSTAYIISLRDFSIINSLVLKINNISIGDVLYSLGKPRFIKGRLNADVDLVSVLSDTNGTYKHSITGYIDGLELAKMLNIRSPNINIKNDVNTVFSNGHGILNLNLASDIGTLSIQNGMIRLSDLYAKFLYKINFNNLRNLSFITPIPLNGPLNLNGDLEYKDLNLDMNFYSSLFKGEVEGSYNGTDIVLNMKDVESNLILTMLGYPNFLKSSVNATINFNTLKKNGNFSVVSSNGYFENNEFSSLLQNILKFDFLKEAFSIIKANGLIKGKEIQAQMIASSANTNMKFSPIKIDLSKNSIDSNWDLNFRGLSLQGEIKGAIANPTIALNKGKTISSNINKLDSNKVINEAKKGINKFLNKIQ